jgi:D-glycero-D-manno-heptose 1,7-bisphosphate phosphatase
MNKAVFLDRDGTVTVGTPTHERVDSVEKVMLFPDVLDALQNLSQLDYKVFLITNQAGIAEGLITLDDFWTINDRVLTLIAPSGVQVTQTYLCPHDESSNCDCRKPKPKLLLDAAREHNIDLSVSWMVGDRVSDVDTGKNAGTRTILVQSGVPGTVAEHADYTAPSLAAAVAYIQTHA